MAKRIIIEEFLDYTHEDVSALVPGKLSAVSNRWELAAEAIAVKIRWFGLLVGYVVVNAGAAAEGHRLFLNAILALGATYAAVDTYFSLRGRVFLGRYPLSISLMEALFIGLLCFFHSGLDSIFRYYYLLSLICCAIRYSSRVTYTTCALHCASYTILYFALPPDRRDQLVLLLMLVVLVWVTWASDAMSLLLKQVGDHLGKLNTALQENQAELEARIAERTSELQEIQAQMLHQEKMAAFGLLAAGIAHEVGNPLTSISSLVQMLLQRDNNSYTQAKLELVNGQLKRIQNTLHELVSFSRPASTERRRLALAPIIDEALNIAKYYKGTKGRIIESSIPRDLPSFYGVHDQLVQVFLNLVLNAIDATEKGGRIELQVRQVPGMLQVEVRDNGAGIAPADRAKIFRPYFTTKKHGTGLGLFVTRKLVQDHEGTVDFESQPGRGAIFRVCLPVDGVCNSEKSARAVPSPLAPG